MGQGKLTKRSHSGMKMIKAKGSKLDKTSFGTPLVVIVAAWEVKLLLIWLYVNPEENGV
jgi:hypothetical protein